MLDINYLQYSQEEEKESTTLPDSGEAKYIKHVDLNIVTMKKLLLAQSLVLPLILATGICDE